MAMRYFNWKLAIVLVVAVAVFLGVAVALHRWQISTRADKALPLAEEAYAAHEWEEAAVQFGRYITRNGDDTAALLKYADAQLNRRPVTGGNVQQAVGAYRAVLRLERDNAEAARRLTELYLRPGLIDQPGEAELIARRYLEGHSDVALRRTLADALWRQRKFEDAATELKSIIEQHPTEVPAYELMGIMAERHVQAVDEPAEFWFDQAVAKNPDSALAYIARAGFRLRRGARENALADLDRATELNPAEVDIRLRLIREYLAANLLDKAREHLRALQAKDPANEQLWQSWADLALWNGTPEEMYTVAETGLQELAEQPWDFMPRAAELYLRSGHMEQAQECIVQMQSKEYPSDVMAYLSGLVAEQQGQLREAVDNWRRAVELGYVRRHPRNVMVYSFLANAYVRLGDVPSAIGQLRVLLSERPSYLEGHLTLIRLLAQTRNWSATLQEARQVQQYAPGHPEAVLLGLQAQVHLLAAEPNSAVSRQEAWQQIEAALARINEASQGALPVRLLQVQVAMSQNKLAEGEVILRELEAAHPSDLRLTLFRAELCVAEGKTEEAKTRLQDALRQFPQSFEVVRSCALLLDRLNDRPGCEAMVKEALGRFEEPQVRREAGLLLAELYHRWQENEKLLAWLTDLAARFPDDIQTKRLLLTCEPVLRESARVQALIDEIKTLEGEGGWQWRLEQARFWTWEATVNKELATRGGRYVQIVKLLQENLAANPSDLASRLLLADVYERAGEAQLALAAYREVLSQSPDSVPVVVRTVAALHRVGQFEEAQRVLQAADERNLDHPDLRRLRLQSSLKRGDLAMASDLLREAAGEDPNDASSGLSLAWILIQQKKFEEAAGLLEDLRTKVSDPVSVIAAEVQIEIQQGRKEEAVRLCDEAVGQFAGASAYLLRAKTCAAMGRNEEALSDYGRAIAADSDKAYPWASRAEFYYSLGRTDDAIQDVRKTLALAPDNLGAQRLAISLFLVSNKRPLIAEAQDLLSQALKTVSEDKQSGEYAQFRLLQARLLLLRGTGPGIEEARRILREITDVHPKYAEAWEWMVQLELDQREPGRALDRAVQGLTHNPDSKRLLLLKALAEKERSPALAVLTLKGLLEQYPQDIEILIELADTYARAERAEQAVQLLRQKAPDFAGPLRRRCETALAAALYASGQKEEAKSLFQTLTQAEPNDPMPVVSLAQLLRRDRRWTELNQHMSRWRASHPDDVTTAAAFASILVGTGDREAVQMAEDLLRMTLRQNPDSMTCLVFLGMLMQDADRHEESMELNRRILQKDPNNVTAMNNLAWVLCEHQKEYDEALALAERGLRMAPEYMDLIDTRGVIYYHQGKHEQAMADFTRCIELYPANSPGAVPPRFHLARVYAAMKRRTQAIEQLKEVMVMNRDNVEQAEQYVTSGRKTHAAKLLKDTLKLQEEMDQLAEALGVREQTAGLSASDIEEARLLLDQLQKGS